MVVTGRGGLTEGLEAVMEHGLELRGAEDMLLEEVAEDDEEGRHRKRVREVGQRGVATPKSPEGVDEGDEDGELEDAREVV